MKTKQGKERNVKMKTKSVKVKAGKSGKGKALTPALSPTGEGAGKAGRGKEVTARREALAGQARPPHKVGPLHGKVWGLEVDRARIFASPTNPRTDFPKEMLEERAESLKTAGQLSAIIVRPRPGWVAKWLKEVLTAKDAKGAKGQGMERLGLELLAGQEIAFAKAEEMDEAVGLAIHDPEAEFEIADGECRWRAAKLAGLKSLRCEVRALSDDEVTAIQWASFLQRKGLSPLEEAAGLARLKAAGWSIDRMVEELGISRTQLFEKLKLARAEGPVRELLAAGKISASVAAIVASVPDKKAQAELVTVGGNRRCAVFDWDGNARSVAEVKEYVEEYCLRQIPWKLDEVFEHKEMVSPACRECPKMTRNMGEENPEVVKGPPRCMGLTCFGERVKAVGQKLRAAAAADGLDYWTREQFQSNNYKSEYCVEGDDVWDGNKDVPAEKLAGAVKHAIVADSGNGKMVRVWLRKDLEGAGVMELDKSAERDRADEEKRQREQALFGFVKAEAMKRLLNCIKGEVIDLPRETAELEVLRGEREMNEWNKDKRAALAGLERGELFETKAKEALSRWYRGDDDFPPFLSRLGIRMDVLKETAKDAFAEHQRVEAEKAAAKAAKKAGKAKGAKAGAGRGAEAEKGEEVSA